MAYPQTRDEALARGFKPVENIEALMHKLTGKSVEDFFKEHNLVAGVVNCNDHNNAGHACKFFPDGHGNVVVWTCQGGACSPQHALIGPAE